LRLQSSNYNVNRYDTNGKIVLNPNGLTCRIDDKCADSDRIYIDTGCTPQANCDAIEEYNDIYLSLGLVYQRDIL
jgi:hypothetical protein